MKIALIVVLCTLLLASYGFKIRQGGNQPTAGATTEIDNSSEDDEIIADQVEDDFEAYVNCIFACPDIESIECSDNCLSQTTQTTNQLSRLQTSTDLEARQITFSASFQQALADAIARYFAQQENLAALASIPDSVEEGIAESNAEMDELGEGISSSISSSIPTVDPASVVISDDAARAMAEAADRMRAEAEAN
jgi:hypothetical protein